MLDEMAALGRLAMVEQAFGLMAGFGMQLWGIVQDLSQLHRIYGDGWETFISNSGVLQYFGSRDKMTAEYFSTLCGVTTIHVFSFSEAISETISSFFSSSSSSPYGRPLDGTSSSSSGSSYSSGQTSTVSANEQQRKLAYPDELMVLHRAAQLVFVENLNPIAAQKVTWFEAKGLAALGVNLHGGAPKSLPKRGRETAALQATREKKSALLDPVFAMVASAFAALKTSLVGLRARLAALPRAKVKALLVGAVLIASAAALAVGIDRWLAGGKEATVTRDERARVDDAGARRGAASKEAEAEAETPAQPRKEDMPEKKAETAPPGAEENGSIMFRGAPRPEDEDYFDPLKRRDVER